MTGRPPRAASTREAQDKFAIASTERAIKANTDGSFAWEMAPVTVKGKAGDVKFDKDEQPFKAKLDKIPGLKPAFKKDGTITAANASSISDGAAALVLMRASTAEKRGLKPVARIVAQLLDEVVAIATERAALLRRMAYLRKTKRLFDLWHVFHMPLVYILFIIVVAHVGITLYMGYVPFMD